MGCGIQLLTGEYFRGGTHVSFNRQCWRKDWCTIAMGQFTHLGQTVFKTHQGQKIPITININPPPSVLLVAGEGGVRTIIIPGDDEVGIAGALQGQPVEIVKAKTVNAFACAQSEWGVHHSGAGVGDGRGEESGQGGCDALFSGMAEVSGEDVEGAEVRSDGDYAPEGPDIPHAAG